MRLRADMAAPLKIQEVRLLLSKAILNKTSFTSNTAMASAFSLLTAGGAKFDKSRFKDDFQLFEAVRCLLFSLEISTNVAVAEKA